MCLQIELIDEIKESCLVVVVGREVNQPLFEAPTIGLDYSHFLRYELSGKRMRDCKNVSKVVM